MASAIEHLISKRFSWAMCAENCPIWDNSGAEIVPNGTIFRQARPGKEESNFPGLQEIVAGPAKVQYSCPGFQYIGSAFINCCCVRTMKASPLCIYRELHGFGLAGLEYKGSRGASCLKRLSRVSSAEGHLTRMKAEG